MTDLTLIFRFIANEPTAAVLQVNEIEHPTALKPAPDLRESAQNTFRVPDAELGHFGRQDGVISDGFRVVLQGVAQIYLHARLNLRKVGGAPDLVHPGVGTQCPEGFRILFRGVCGGEVEGVIQNGGNEQAGGGGYAALHD